MNYLVFDTETSGLPNFKIQCDTSARIVQMSAILLDEDFEEVACFSTLIKLSDGTKIQPGAFQAHGISEELCEKFGINIESALRMFDGLAEKADKMVAHNLKFDAYLLDTEQTLAGYPKFDVIKHGICTMLASTPICKLPGRGGNYKWPKLAEVYNIFYPNAPMFDAHDALVDVRATGQVLKYLVQEFNLLQS